MNIFKNTSVLLFSLLLIFGLASFTACEGPAGPEGPQGEVGPAGDDGSQMYAGTGSPASDIGDIGDYYLNTSTGEYYGPKESNGWGNPIIVLMGDDGTDGQDGSQIYSGSGTPDVSLGQEGDFYLDKSSFDLYGPKTASGWGMPLNIKGADGNANVTRYLFSGHDFGNDFLTIVNVPVEDASDLKQSAWLVYLVRQTTGPETYYSIPGPAASFDTFYTFSYGFAQVGGPVNRFLIKEKNQRPDALFYDRIEIVRIEASNTDDRTGVNDTLIPGDLDISAYNTVAEYYGFDSKSY